MTQELDKPYSVRPARYAKGMLIVTCDPNGGYKSRAQRLIGDGLNARWTNREGGYTASPSKVARFERLYSEGWDACSFTGALEPPQNKAEEV